MPDQTTPMQNADVSTGFGDDDIRADYDKGREERAAAQTSEEIGEARELRGGTVVASGTAPLASTETLFPGAALRGLSEDGNGGIAARAAKGLDVEGVTAEDTSWTAQSARPFISSNAEDVPGQTFRAEELPDPLVVNASNLPTHTIPAGLVVDVDVPTDNLNTSQEGGDSSTGPREAQAPAPQAAQSKEAGRTVRGSKADKADSELNK